MSMWATNPQAAQIDALIERAGLLTGVECDRLVAAWDAARAAAGDAAQSAAGDAAQSAAGDADRGVVRDAARDAARAAARFAAGDAAAAWVAAWVSLRSRIPLTARVAARHAAWFVAQDASAAAEALVVRDLIDEATEWNRAAYDLLTGPWRRTIGPVHSDDEVLR